MAVSPRHTPEKPGDTPDSSGMNASAAQEETRPRVGVRYGAMNWIGEFQLPRNVVLKPGAKVVIQSDRGIELGEPVALTRHDSSQSVSCDQITQYLANSGAEFYRLNAGKVLREASPQDVDEHQRLNSRIREDIQRCASEAARLNLDMKVITAEHVLGGERIVLYFRSDGRVDFRDLVCELARHYQTRIEMRQVGARDEARLVGDYEVCGRPCCCKVFLKKLRPVTMRMAKLQKSTLDPSKVSGRCGRLRCCLRYEHDGYDELLSRLPRTGTRVQTEFGPATVIDRQALTQLLLVRTEDERELTVPAEEVSPLDAATGKPAEVTIEPDVAADSSADQPAEQEEGKRPGRRRHPRGRRGAAREAPDEASEDGALKPAIPEAPAVAPETGQTSEPPAEGGDEAQADAPVPRRRRRRRRRPRRGRPNSSANSGES